MYHCPMPDPKVLNAVTAVNPPLVYRPPPDAGLAILHVDDDLLIVDNGRVLHGRHAFPADSGRLLKRLRVL